MQKSSIHIQKANIYFILHSLRANKSNSIVFLDEQNEYLYNKKTAFKILRDELKKREFAYTQRTGKKLPKNTIKLMSAIVNLNKNHNLEDVKKIAEYLEQTLNTKVVSVAIHRDEGKLINKETGEEFYSGIDFILNEENNKLYWIDENKNLKEEIDLEKFEIVKNYHAHIEFLGLDSNGNAIKRNKLTKWYLSNLQSRVADILGMERGYNYYKSNKKAPKRLDVKEFKRAGVNKRKGMQEALAKVKDLKEENKKLRELLKELGAERQDYAYLEEHIKKIKEFIKQKKLTEKQLKEKIKQLEEELKRIIEEKNKKLSELEEENKKLKEKAKELNDLEFYKKKVNIYKVTLIPTNSTTLYLIYNFLEELKQQNDILDYQKIDEKTTLIETPYSKIVDKPQQIEVEFAINKGDLGFNQYVWEHEISLLIDLALQKGWKLQEIQATGSEKFVNAVNQEIRKRLKKGESYDNSFKYKYN